ncbi:MAG TPA: P1 family peptidase [Thermoleophilia bacterium]|nr:P1 family peptidase [Thermoleophilia bacterium]
MRARDLGIEIGLGTPGPLNAITDVAGVRVGAVTLVQGDGPLVVGKGPVRTGVTVIVPHEGEVSEEPLFAGCHTLNGNGEFTGLEWVRESGLLMSPIALTNTHSVGVVRDALVRREVEARGPGKLYWSMPHVGETWDGYLNDVGGQHVHAEHVAEALARVAGGPVPEGNAGGGTGMICHDFKGGTGTASRVVELGGERFTVAALVQANHSSREVFSVNGVPVGQILDDAAVPLPVAPEEAGREVAAPSGAGSIIVVIATDAPLLPVQLRRLAQRAGMGLAYLGAYGDHFSGDIFVAFSTANRGIPRQDYGVAGPVRLRAEWVSLPHFDVLLQGAAEATAEAILNAMLQAETMVGRDGVTAYALDGPRLVEILDRYGRRTYRP